MKKVLFTIMLFGFIYPLAKSAAADNSVLVGSWKCSVPDVAYQYSNSLITFFEKEGILTGTVTFESGQEVKITTVKFTDGQLLLSLYVEGNSISVSGKVASGKITGTVDTPDGKVNFTATKAAEKKK